MSRYKIKYFGWTGKTVDELGSFDEQIVYTEAENEVEARKWFDENVNWIKNAYAYIEIKKDRYE